MQMLNYEYQAFRPGNVDLPEAAVTAAVGATDDPRFFGALPMQDFDFPELAETAFAQKYAQSLYFDIYLLV
jgi:hypothetical protein